MAKMIWRTGRILIGLSIVLALILTVILSVGGGARDVDVRPVMTDPAPVVLSEARTEQFDQRTAGQRVWSIVRQVQTTDSKTSSTQVDEVVSKIVEVGDGICYQDADGTWQVTDARWRQVKEGFELTTAGYFVSVGETAGTWLQYQLKDRPVFLAPTFLLADDGVRIQPVAELKNSVRGAIDPNDPSRLVFAGAFGKGIDLEYQVKPGGFHQNVIFRNAVSLPEGMDPNSTEIHLYTQIQTGEPDKKQMVFVQVGKSGKVSLSESFTKEATKESLRLMQSVEQDGQESEELLCEFSESPVFHQSNGRLDELGVARKKIVQNESNQTYLVETLSHKAFQQATYPVVWDYVAPVGSDITADTVWYADATYNVTANVSVTDGKTLRIEPGTFVKFNSGTKLGCTGTGKIIARGKPYRKIVFTAKYDSYNGESLGSGSVNKGYYTGIELGDDSQFEFCTVLYASKGVSVKGNLGLPIQHCYLYKCYTSIELQANSLLANEKLVIFNNLLVPDPCSPDPCDVAAINILADVSDPCDVSILIHNNTIVNAKTGIAIHASCHHRMSLQNNILYHCTTGISGGSAAYSSLITIDYNGYYSNTTDVNVPNKTGGSNSKWPTAYPFYGISSINSYYLNATSGGGAAFLNSGNASPYMAGYTNPYEWSVHYIGMSHSERVFSSATTISSSNSLWEPKYDTCDISGNVDLGYHHPRIDYFIDSATVTVNGVGLTIKPGTVVVQEVSTSGAGKVTVTANNQLDCIGNPFGGGYITWVSLGRAGNTCNVGVPYSNTQLYVELGSGSTYDIQFTEFIGLGFAVTLNSGNGIFRDNRLFMNTRGMDLINCSSFQCSNNVFSANNLTCRVENGSVTIKNCTFDRNAASINWAAASTSGSVNVVNCLFTNNTTGIRINANAGSITDSFNIFYNNSGGHIYNGVDPANIVTYNGVHPSTNPPVITPSGNGDISTLATEPYDLAWTNVSDRFCLIQSNTTSGMDLGDAISGGMPGYSTALSKSMDSGRIDIGYHYPLNQDTDLDMLPDYQEYWLGTNYQLRDSDSDGLTDFQEILYGSNPNDNDGDTDNDGVPDWWEVQFTKIKATVDDDDLDNENGTTGDGLSSLEEWQNRLNPDIDNRNDSWTDYEYDGSGNVTKELRKEVRQTGTSPIDSAVFVTSEKRMDYDKLGRMKWEWQLASVGSANPTTDDTIMVTLYDRDGAVKKTFKKGIAASFTSSQYSTIDAQKDIVTEYRYDAAGRMTSQIFDPNQGGMQLTTTYAYDAAGRQTSVTLPGSRTSTSYYDVLDRVTKATNAEGAITETTYNSRNRTIKSLLYTVAGANTTYFTQQRIYYNVFGDLTRQAVLSSPGETGAYGTFTPSTSNDRVIDYASDYTSASRYRYTYTYNSGNAVTAISQTSSDDNSGRGLPTIVTQGQATSQPKVTQKRFYDKAGRVTQEIRENYENDSNILRTTTQMVYDNFGRATSSIAVGATNLTTAYSYDGDDRPINVKLPQNNETNSSYDALGRMTSKVEDSGVIARPTTYIYDRLGRQVTLIANDGTNNQTTVYTYDKASHVVTTTYPDTLSIRYAYGNTGQVTQRIDQRGVTTNYNYDNLGRLVTKYKQNDTIKEVYAYDARGLVITAKKGDNQTGDYYDNISSDILTYNGLGSQITSVQKVNGTTAKTIAYTRTPLGQASSITYPDSVATMNYTYSSLGQIDTIARSGTTLVDYNYYGSQVHTRTYNQANVTHTVAYDAFGRISTYNTVKNNVGVKFAYTYDNNSNIITLAFNHRSSTHSYVYSYDTLDRVTKGQYFSDGNEEFVYDKLGNRSTETDSRTNEPDYSYLHDPVNEYTRILVDGITKTPGYDAAGNLTKDHRGDNGYRYFYDHDNRMTQIKDSGGSVKPTYTYDALGRRVRMVDEAASPKVTTNFYYDGQKVLLDADGSNPPVAQKYYVWGNYIDEALMMKKLTGDNQGDYYYGHDHLYSVSVLFASDGTVSERYEYDAYGKTYIMDGSYTARTASSLGNRYTFTGRELDSIDSNALKIMYYRARSYDPTTGRFLQRDPIGYVDVTDLYQYVESDPQGGLDPFGLIAEPPGIDPPGEGGGGLIVISPDTGKNDAWWHKHHNKKAKIVKLPGKIVDDIYIGDPIEDLIEIIKNNSGNCGCIYQLIISGHGGGSESGGISASPEGPKDITADDIGSIEAMKIASRLCDGARVYLCGCFSDGHNKLQMLANKLQATVCGCKGPNTTPCKCEGAWVCKGPTIENGIVREVRAKRKKCEEMQIEQF